MSGSESVEERQARMGRNETLFRAVNERINELNDLFTVVPDTTFEIICECGNEVCFDQIQIQTGEYARIRTDPTLFIIVPGHQDSTVEAVVQEEQRAYVIVRKHPGGPADLAAEEMSDS